MTETETPQLPGCPTPMLRGTPEEFAAALGSEANKMLKVQPGEKVDF